MICPNCQKQVADTSKFCSACGASLLNVQAMPAEDSENSMTPPEINTQEPVLQQQDNTEVAQDLPENCDGAAALSGEINNTQDTEQSVSSAPAVVFAPTEQPEMVNTEAEKTSGVTTAVKNVAKSPVFIILAIAFCAGLVISILDYFSTMDFIRTLGYFIPYEIIGTMNIIYTAFSVISGIPSLLTSIALLLIVVAAFKKTYTMPTAGISILRGLTIYNIILVSLSAVISLLGILLLVMSATSSGNSEAVASVIFVALIYIISFVLVYVFYIKLFKTLGAAKSAASGNPVRKNASIFVTVIFFILAAVTIIGLVSKYTVEYIYYDLCAYLGDNMASYIAALFRPTMLSVIVDVINIIVPVTAGITVLHLKINLHKFVKKF